jgi:hypothetical protein
MTLSEIMASDKDFLFPADVAKVLRCDQYSINLQAKADPARLGFPVCMMGNVVRIPRLGFLHWLQYGNAPVSTGNAGGN